MPYVPITINRKSLTIMGVAFPDSETLEITADAIGSNMFEGFQPTRRGIEIIRDYCLGKLSWRPSPARNPMRNEYQYIDPDAIYTDPATGEGNY